MGRKARSLKRWCYDRPAAQSINSGNQAYTKCISRRIGDEFHESEIKIKKNAVIRAYDSVVLGAALPGFAEPASTTNWIYGDKISGTCHSFMGVNDDANDLWNNGDEWDQSQTYKAITDDHGTKVHLFTALKNNGIKMAYSSGKLSKDAVSATFNVNGESVVINFCK